MLNSNDRQLIKESVHRILFQDPDTTFDSLVDTITDSIWELMPYELQDQYDALKKAVRDESEKHWYCVQGTLAKEHLIHMCNSRMLISEYFNSRGVK